MLKSAAAAFVLLGVLEGCSSSHAVLTNCTYLPNAEDAGDAGDGGAWSCPGNMACGYSGPGADGLCHGLSLVCAIPCEASTDCIALGENAVCSSACGPAICTPYQ